MADRYDTSKNIEGQFQPGSQGQVLLNKREVIDPAEMNNIERNLLKQLNLSVLDDVTEDQTIASDDLCEWHRCWLGNVYVCSGKFYAIRNRT